MYVAHETAKSLLLTCKRIHPANYPDRQSLECAPDRTMVSANSERGPLWVALALYRRGCNRPKPKATARRWGVARQSGLAPLGRVGKKPEARCSTER